MLGRRSKTAVMEKEVTDVGGKAAETVSDLAERAVSAARDAQRVATPVLRSAALTSAETLSHAAEKAAGMLADRAEKLAASDAGVTARTKLADASEAVAGRVRPRKRRRVRKLLFLGVIGGAIFAVLKYTPLKSKISELAFGPAIEDDEPEPITLPVSSPPSPSQPSSVPPAGPGASHESEPPTAPSAEGDGVASSIGKGDGAKA